LQNPKWVTKVIGTNHVPKLPVTIARSILEREMKGKLE
jgi:hypothetical protein